LQGALDLDELAKFDEARVDDEGATVASLGKAQTVPHLDAFVSRAISTANAFARSIARLPPPDRMKRMVPAWQAFAERLGGRLDLGPMAIRAAALGAETVEVETLWSRKGEVEGTAVRVLLSPPLERPLDLESPETSREACELATAVAAEARGTHFGPDSLEALTGGPLQDPAVIEPVLEKLSRLARAIRGIASAGPFR